MPEAPRRGVSAGRGVNTASAMRRRLPRFYRRLIRRYGPQHWWPGETRFEIMVGAVLTQNTAWRNVERAIDNLRQAGCLSLEALLQFSASGLADLVRPAGCHRVKSTRLLALCVWLRDHGGIDRVRRWSTAPLRASLLEVRGVGPETADAILLYAFRRQVFVIDAYTRRIFGRAGLVTGVEPYEVLRAALEQALRGTPCAFGEYHALLVHHAKTACRKRPDCTTCCLRPMCAFGRNAPSTSSGKLI